MQSEAALMITQLQRTAGRNPMLTAFVTPTTSIPQPLESRSEQRLVAIEN
jgi:hypothetical protein